MVEPRILIVGQRPDPHIEAVEARLKRLGCDTWVFDRWNPGQTATMCFGEPPAGWLTINRRRIPLDSFSAVWWRVKPARPVEFSSPDRNLSDGFALREWRSLLRCLPYFTEHALWVNPLDHHQRAELKPWQLLLALKAGLEFPCTRITNSSDDVVKTLSASNRVVYKTLSSFISPPDEIVFTNVVTRSAITRSRKEIACAPGIFQKYIQKDHELRVTIINKRMTVVRIDSQKASTTKIDWRRDQSRAMYRPGALSQTTRDRLMRFHQEAGLVFAAYDFIVTPDGREVFLECNPGGQWLWLERCLGLDITAQLVDALVNDVSTSVTNDSIVRSNKPLSHEGVRRREGKGLRRKPLERS
jgi:hypothetical protein